MERPVNLIEYGTGMSNLDHTVDDGMKELLQKGEHYIRHAGWNFNGQVWWDGEKFREEVWTYGSIREVFEADDLKSLMEIVNNEYGWE